MVRLFYLFTTGVFTSCYFLFFGVIWGLTALFDRNREVSHVLSRWWAKSIYALGPGWNVRVCGRENIGRGPYIVISNHQAMLDIPLLYVLPFNFKWVSKREVYKIPVFGTVLWMHGDVAIERGGTASTKKMIENCIDYLKDRVSVIIFPEGTRTRTGRVGKFKEGAFVLAKHAGYPILPVVVEGTGRITMKNIQHIPLPGQKQTPKTNFTVKILKPISPEEIAASDTAELARRCQRLIAKEHETLRPDLYATQPNNE